MPKPQLKPIEERDPYAALRVVGESLEWYRRRLDLLARVQKHMRDPERQLVCDILANGQLLPDPDGSRYGFPANGKEHLSLPHNAPDHAAVMEAFDNQSTACRLCEFEEGWGKPFCGACGNIFDEVPILQRIREYVAGVNDDYREDEERDQTLAMIDALIRHNGHSAGNPAGCDARNSQH